MLVGPVQRQRVGERHDVDAVSGQALQLDVADADGFRAGAVENAQAGVLLGNAGADAESPGAVDGHEAAVFPRGYKAGNGPASGLQAVGAEAKQVLFRVGLVHGAEKASVRREHEA